MAMQEISTKVAKVIRHAPEGWTRDDVRHLIHGVGGSPRRAKRLLKNPGDDGHAVAIELRDAFAKDATSGVPYVTALKAANERYAAKFGAAAEEHDEEPEAQPEPVKPVRRSRRSLTQMAASVASVQ